MEESSRTVNYLFSFAVFLFYLEGGININYLDEFEVYMKLDNSSSNTIKNYKPDVEKFMAFINKDPSMIERIDVINFISILKDRELDAKTINRKIYAIYKFIQFLNAECGLKIDFNIKKLKVKIAKQEYARNILNKTDFKRILNAAYRDGNISFYTLLMTLYLTGMRISEALSVKLKDIKKKEIVVTGKGDKQRYIPVPDELKKYWKEYAVFRKDSSNEYLFLNAEDRRLTAWMSDYYIKKYASQTKVEIKKAHCHNIRHLFGYVCINERGMTIDEVSQLMGHSDINITKTYIRKTRKQLQENMKDFRLE